MLDYLAYTGELATARVPSDSTRMSEHAGESRQEECSDWGNYALFVFEQQGHYCQLV